jgi:hypothetical protein
VIIMLRNWVLCPNANLEHYDRANEGEALQHGLSRAGSTAMEVILEEVKLQNAECSSGNRAEGACNKCA